MRVLLPILALAACPSPSDDTGSSPIETGAPQDSGTDSAAAGECIPQLPPPAPLRSLTRTEIDRSVADLLGTPGTTRARLPDDPTVHGFEGFAETVAPNQLLVDGYMRASEDVTGAVDWASTLPCDPASGDQTCAESFIDSFGGRAFRRPLLPAERQIFVDLFVALEPSQGFDVAMAAIVQAMLQSPQFLYKLELGVEGATGDAVPLTPHELAARLSYFLWASTPDDELLAAAADGTLSDPDVLSAQVDRLLADSRAHDAVSRFVEQWMHITHLDERSKDALAFPDWTPGLAADLREETRRFAASAVFEEPGTLDALLTSNQTWVNGAVAAHYGLPSPADPDSWERATLPANQRAGILTHASFLSSAAHNNQTSPVHRGLFVYEQLFCGVQPQPPDDLDITLPPLDDTISTRERFARHTQDPICSGCHSVMDPVGIGFEHYDPVGRWRTDEGSGVPVDASGLMTYSSQQGSFYGAIDLSGKVAAAPEVKNCFATQWFRAAWGREPGDADVCTIDSMQTAFEDGRVLDLVRHMPHTNTFQQRARIEP